MKNTIIKGSVYREERPLFAVCGVTVEDCIFEAGESPLKEVSDVQVHGGKFLWKYPLWYAANSRVTGTYFGEMARAGVWYGKDLSLESCRIDAPKIFRRCSGLVLKDIEIPNAAETLWNCEQVTLEDLTVTGDYFGMGCKDIQVKNLTLNGNYSFDGCRNLTIEHSRLLSKDCIWNSENVTIRDSYIEGEYLAWNSKHVTLINCEIKSLQGLCYVEDLKLEGCRLAGTSLAFEYSTVDAEIIDQVDSVMNPSSGRIRVPVIDKLIMDKSKVDVDKTRIDARVEIRLEEFDGII